MKYSAITSALVGATAVVALPSYITQIGNDIAQIGSDIIKDLGPLLQPVSYGRHLVSLEEAQVKYKDFPKWTCPAEQGEHEFKDFAHDLEVAFKNGTLDILPRATAAQCASNPNIRFEWDDYSESDRQALMSAFKCLKNKPSQGYKGSTNRYEDFASVHQAYTPNIHNNQKFLFWHRYFLWAFEQALRKECGFNRAFVWFDETKHAGAFSGSDLFSSKYLGTLGGAQHCVTDGAFAGYNAHIGPGNSYTTHCLSRKGDASDTAQCSSGYINYCNTMADYKNYEVCLENGPHGYGHNGLGGVMEDVYSSPQEPFFWFHHAFVDRAFRIWELADTGSRYSKVDGVDASGSALTLNTKIYMNGLAPDTTVGAIINTLSGKANVCYRYNY